MLSSPGDPFTVGLSWWYMGDFAFSRGRVFLASQYYVRLWTRIPAYLHYISTNNVRYVMCLHGKMYAVYTFNSVPLSLWLFHKLFRQGSRQAHTVYISRQCFHYKPRIQQSCTTVFIILVTISIHRVQYALLLFSGGKFPKSYRMLNDCDLSVSLASRCHVEPQSAKTALGYIFYLDSNSIPVLAIEV